MILKKKSTAIAVLALVFLAGTLFGTHRSLSHLRSQTQEAFYEGTDASGYGIATNLKLRVEYARNLCKIADGYGADTQLREVEAACSALENASDAGEKYNANVALSAAVTGLSDALASASLSEEDAGYRKELTADIASYEMRIDKLAASYNSEVRSFNNDIMAGIPAGPLGRLTGISLLEEYQ